MNQFSFDVSILVVNWNTRDLLDKCLESIPVYKNSKISIETIVVDNASEDESQALVRNKYPEVELIENSENIGFARAVNQAASVARGKYLLLLNSDARFVDDQLIQLVDFLDSEDSIGIVAGPVGRPGKDKEIAGYRFPTVPDLIKIYTLDCVYRFSKTHPGRGKFRSVTRMENGTTVYEPDWLAGCYMLLRRELMEEKNLLDHRIFMYYEDTLLCQKAWNLGYRVVGLDMAGIDHESGASARKVSTIATCHSYSSSRIYVSEAKGPRFLWWYESTLRFLWKLFIPLFVVLSLVGLGARAREKRSIFTSLLAIPRLS